MVKPPVKPPVNNNIITKIILFIFIAILIFTGLTLFINYIKPKNENNGETGYNFYDNEK